jgi:hypothetical protein
MASNPPEAESRFPHHRLTRRLARVGEHHARHRERVRKAAQEQAAQRAEGPAAPGPTAPGTA